MSQFKYFYSIILTSIILLTTNEINAQKFSGLDKSPHDISYYRKDNNAMPLIKVTYGRPQLRGRTVGKEIAPYGEVWRTGANEATEIKFYKDVLIGDTIIPAGTYTLFTIPDKKEWTFILNKDVDVWGAYSYDKTKDVIRVKGISETDKESLDALSIAFEDDDNGKIEMAIGWGKVRSFLPIEFPENKPSVENETPPAEKDKSEKTE